MRTGCRTLRRLAIHHCPRIIYRRVSKRLPAPFVRFPETGNVVMSENPDVKPPVEVNPSVAGEISAIASAHAPFLYFEDASAFGHLSGIISITLEAARIIPAPGKRSAAVSDRVIVAHLRMNMPAAHSLKAAIDGALLLAAQAAGSQDQSGPKPN
jgi:hypothetical protein